MQSIGEKNIEAAFLGDRVQDNSNKSHSRTMRVLKRTGELVPVDFEKVHRRIRRLCEGSVEHKGVAPLKPLENIDPAWISQQVIQHLKDGVSTTELDEYTAQLAADYITTHPDYGDLAIRVSISNHHKNTLAGFMDTMELLKFNNFDARGNRSSIISDELWETTVENSQIIQEQLDFGRDYTFDSFGFATLCRGYLSKITSKDKTQKIVERPQHMWMRVAIGIHGNDLESAFETYHMMSKGYYTHASPTLYNAGTRHPQLSSCFLLSMKDDSIDGIYDTLRDCARISKYAGGIGLAVSNIRAAGSMIRGTNGKATGIVPMLRNYNATARYVNQGGKRLGSFAVYLEPWHADVFEFLELRKNHGDEEQRARDLFYALWIPDLFMKRCMNNGDWSLFCPDECPGLVDTYGDEFEALYNKYESEGLARRTIPARELWEQVIRSQIETGTPYICFKDASNRTSNQKHLGVIRCSNLCSEIVQYTSKDEIAVCNLASLGLPKYVKEDMTYDHELLHSVAKRLVKNLDKVIDINFYPVEEARNSNLRHRPMGVGVQGLADVFAKMKFPYDSDEASVIDKEIFETIYHACIESSVELAIEKGVYPTFEGSPASQGQLQFDLWGVTPDSGRYDWDDMKKRVVKHGLRNSLLVALMPTASTSQIMGNHESFEPFSGNIYLRKTLTGENKLINKYLVNDLIELNMWSEEMRDRIIAAGGSIQGMPDVPADLRARYKTVWEIKQRIVLQRQAQRGAYVCQSASNNIYVQNPDIVRISNMQIYAWHLGLCTGTYYLRVAPEMEAAQITIDPALAEKEKAAKAAKLACSLANREACEMCSA